MVLVDAWVNLANVIIYVNRIEILRVQILDENLRNAIALAVDGDEVSKIIKFS